MEGKLFKMVEGYTLSLTGSIDDLYGISDKQLAEDHKLHKLSLKNCEAIANGYDLDELANRAFHYMGYHSTITPHEEKQFKLGYNIAFREALEILGDKKFSEEDMIEFAKWVFLEVGSNTGKDRTNKELFDEYQSLQQTEWDVVVERETVISNFNGNIAVSADFKLDGDGCLILKRK